MEDSNGVDVQITRLNWV